MTTPGAHRRTLRLAPLALAVGLGLAAATTPPAAGAPPELPTCVRTPLDGRELRLSLTAGDVVRGRVRSVRLGRAFATRSARGGTWRIDHVIPRAHGDLVHVVVKSDARRFSERRWSGWIECVRREAAGA